jgi:hypothetical protein
MQEIDKKNKIENNKKKITRHLQNNSDISSKKPLREKNQLKGEIVLLSFLWYGNSTSTKEKALSMDFPKNCGM